MLPRRIGRRLRDACAWTSALLGRLRRALGAFMWFLKEEKYEAREPRRGESTRVFGRRRTGTRGGGSLSPPRWIRYNVGKGNPYGASPCGCSRSFARKHCVWQRFRKGGISMFEIFGAVLLAGVIVALAATGVVATIFAVVAVVCVVLAVICMFLGAAFVLVFRIAVAVLVALVLKWLYSRVLAFLGERGALTALRDASLVNRVSWILAAATTATPRCRW